MSKVLVVDDNPTDLQVFKAYLERRGIETITHDTSLGTLPKAVREQPDLIVLDIGMPGLDGPSLCRMLKGQSVSDSVGHIPVLLHSSVPESDLTNHVKVCGADGYLHKSWPMERKLEVVQSHLK